MKKILKTMIAKTKAMVTKARCALATVTSKVHTRVLQTALIASAALFASPVAFAEGPDGGQILSIAIKVLGGIAIVGGGIRLVTGLMAYSEAKEEGEGPAMAKAKGQITAAVILAGVGTAAITFSGPVADWVDISFEA